MWHKNILETIGNTPLIQLNRLPQEYGIKATVLAKVEYFNPGNSVKDRMALKMIEDAEADGRLKPGGTVIEGTSGNTGMGLALACCIKGYKLICVSTDKQSKEKFDVLRAMGAEVIVCPTNVDASDPRSYYSTSKRLSEETPNSFYPNQYDNLSNRMAHYESTGPEIWEQTEGKITHFLVGVGTGGTISGVGKYLHEQNPDIKNWGIDTYGSVFKKYHETGIFDETEIYPYVTEGIGEDILPANVDFSLIDRFEKVTDKDGCIYTRELAKKEGIFVGNSAGSCMAGLIQLKDELTEDDVVVMLFHDHGSRYTGKMFNDDWMKVMGYLDYEHPRAIDLIQSHKDQKLVTVAKDETVSSAIEKMKNFDISQIPVVDGGKFIGSLDDFKVYSELLGNQELLLKPVSEIMQAPFPQVSPNDKLEDVSKCITKENNAVLVTDEEGNDHIITRHDIIEALK